MICLLQRVSYGSVVVDESITGEIHQGLVVLCGFQPHDNDDSLERMAHKVLHYRLFADEAGKTNLNVQQVNGEVLLVPQFTLAADTQKGLRPSFHTARAPAEAEQLFNQFSKQVENKHQTPKTGVFGADMSVTIHNDGPMTFWLEN